MEKNQSDSKYDIAGLAVAVYRLEQIAEDGHANWGEKNLVNG